MLNFLQNPFSPQNNNERKLLNEAESKQLDLIQERFRQEASQMSSVPSIPTVTPLDVFPISQKFSKYSNLPYGKISTIDDAGCGPLAVEYALRILGFTYTFEEVLNECVAKGYRAYIYDDSGNIVDGNGTEYALFTNHATLLQGAYDLINYLQKGCPVTLLVNNAIYHNDKKRKGNHFVTMIGIDENHNAIIMDGNLIITDSDAALVRKNFWEIAPGIRCSWAWEKSKMMAYLD